MEESIDVKDSSSNWLSMYESTNGERSGSCKTIIAEDARFGSCETITA
jgi:hypothetical protein